MDKTQRQTQRLYADRACRDNGRSDMNGNGRVLSHDSPRTRQQPRGVGGHRPREGAAAAEVAVGSPKAKKRRSTRVFSDLRSFSPAQDILGILQCVSRLPSVFNARSMWPSLRSLVVLSLVGWRSANAYAADPSSAADALFREGRAAQQRGEALVACGLFQDSYKLEPTVGTLLNLGTCRTQLGRTASALAAYKEALERMSPGDDRRPLAQTEMTKLEPRVPHVLLRLQESSCEQGALLHDGLSLPWSTIGLPFAVDPGEHHVELECQGFERSSAVYTAVDSQVYTLTIGRGAPKNITTIAPDTRKAKPRMWSWIAVASGGTMLVGGAVTGVMLLGDASTVRSDCDEASHTCRTQAGEDAKSRGRVLEWVTPSLLVGGAVLGGVGLYGLLKPHAANEKTAWHWTLSPTGASLYGSF